MTRATENEPERLARRIARLTTWVVGLSLLWLATVAWIAWIAWRPSSIPPVLALERLEIREPDGSLAFVLASSHRPVAATIDGQQLLEGQEEERRNPTFIFFDGKGSEVGGMQFATHETSEGFSALRYLAMDAHKQDQTIAIGHVQDPEGASAGLRVWDRPWDLSVPEALAELGLEVPATRAEIQQAVVAIPEEKRATRLRELFEVERLFLGSTREDAAELTLRDGQGRPRIVLEVPSEGEPAIRVLDEGGDTILRLPQTQ